MKSGEWRLIEDGLRDGGVNMATDHAILQAVAEGQAPPTVRLYGWKSPALTVGYSQNIGRDVDLARCGALGIPIVRRPTGGRAVLHDAEITYCVVAPIDHPRFPPSLGGTFRVVAEALLLCLAEMGIQDGAIAGGAANGGRRNGDRPARTGSSLPVDGGRRFLSCFASINHCEIAVRDRKLIGSAQRRTSRAFLQHGSALIDCDRGLLNSLFLFKDAGERRQNLERLRRSTATLNEVRGRETGFEEARRAFREGFRRAFAEGLAAGELSPFESVLRDGFLSAVLP